jgi:hypothetical protein
MRRERIKEIENVSVDSRSRPLVMPLETFMPHKGEKYFVEPTTSSKSVLVAFLKHNY